MTRTVPAAVLAMPPGEWTVALYASDMPTRRADHSPEQITAWIAQGVERLGGDLAVWSLNRTATRLLRTDWEWKDAPAEWLALWPKRRRYLQSGDVAWAFDTHLRASGIERRVPMVEVWFEPDEFGDVYSVRVPERDLEMERRLAAEQSERERRAA